MCVRAFSPLYTKACLDPTQDHLKGVVILHGRGSHSCGEACFVSSLASFNVREKEEHAHSLGSLV